MKRVRERQREDEGEAGISGRRLLKQNTVAACLSPGQRPFAVFADQITRPEVLTGKGKQSYHKTPFR